MKIAINRIAEIYRIERLQRAEIFSFSMASTYKLALAEDVSPCFLWIYKLQENTKAN